MNLRPVPAAACLALLAAVTPALGAPDSTPLAGLRPAWATQRVGAAEDTDLVSIAAVLPWRDPIVARRLAYAVSDPSHVAYGQHVSPAEWRARFAPSAALVASVQAWFRSTGLTLGEVPQNQLVVPARGTVAQVERLVGVPLGSYDVGGRTLRAPDAPPRVPAALAAAGVTLRGLDEGHLLLTPGAYEPPPPLPEEPATPADTTPPNAVVYGPGCSAFHGQRANRALPAFDGRRQPMVTCATSPQALRAAYGVTGARDGRGETVVMVGSHAIRPLRSDIDTWSRRHRLQALRSGQLRQVSYPGAYQTPVAEPVLRHSVWAVQAATLLETVHAIAPAADLLYVGTTSSFDLANGTLLAVDRQWGDVVINGWYSATEDQSEANVALISRIAEQAAATGISLLFASGDLGSADGRPVYPANEPMATAVGATSLILGPNGRYVRELAWAKAQWFLEDGEWVDDLAATFRGSGGGTSGLHDQPAYQRGVVPAGIARRADGSLGRSVPDIAVMGDAETGMSIGYTQRFPDGTDRYSERRLASGTASTALFAGLLALGNQQAKRNLGFVNPLLYRLAARRVCRDVVPWGRAGAGTRVDYVDGATPASGVRHVLKQFEQFLENPPRVGFDTATGLGSPGPAFLRSLK